MYIKVVTVKVKRKTYRYVRVVHSEYTNYGTKKGEKVIATLGTLEHVQRHIYTLKNGLERIERL